MQNFLLLILEEKSKQDRIEKHKNSNLKPKETELLKLQIFNEANLIKDHNEKIKKDTPRTTILKSKIIFKNLLENERR